MKVYGDYLSSLPTDTGGLEISFFLNSSYHWSTNSLMSQCLADYFKNNFPTNENESYLAQAQEEVRDSINYIANELLENAVKFHSRPVYQVKCGLALDQTEVIIYVTNIINRTSIAHFQLLIEKLTSGNLEELLVQQMEANTIEGHGSGLGLLTIMYNYKARLGWKFEKVLGAPNSYMVTTMARYAGPYGRLRAQLESDELAAIGI